LEDGEVGVRLLSGLPEGNGLPSVADKVLDDPKPVFALVELRPHREVHTLETDSHTVVLKLAQVEPLEGDEAKKLREQLDKVRERRTGAKPLIGSDGQPNADAVPDAEVPATTTDTPAAAGDTSGAAPAFTPPTPIGRTKTR
jgi:hypothetical protein